MHRWMDGWMYEWMDERTDGWMAPYVARPQVDDSFTFTICVIMIPQWTYSLDSLGMFNTHMYILHPPRNVTCPRKRLDVHSRPSIGFSLWIIIGRLLDVQVVCLHWQFNEIFHVCPLDVHSITFNILNSGKRIRRPLNARVSSRIKHLR